LVQAFARGEVQKTYLALVWGHPESAGRIEKPIGRHPVQRQRMSTLSRRGKPALTSWQVLRCYGGPLSLLQVSIHTGRTHQIRVHMADAGFPIVGDAVYGGKQAGRLLPGSGQIAPRQMLHAWSLSFRHPLNGQVVNVTAKLPDDFENLLKNLTEAASC
jgi:23S rRNA pseudouridine1911/1915/1917 synthase